MAEHKCLNLFTYVVKANDGEECGGCERTIPKGEKVLSGMEHYSSYSPAVLCKECCQVAAKLFEDTE